MVSGREAYLRLRTSAAWIWVILLGSLAWMAWNSLGGLPHFDDAGFPILTLFLSIEASVAASMILVEQAKQSAKSMRQDEHMLHLMEAVHAILSERSRSVP